MGILDIIGQTASTPIKEAGSVLDKIFTSDDERLSHAEVMERIKQNPQLWQADTNKIDASSEWWFQSGWRPALGWVSSLSLFFYFIPQYIIASYLWAIMCLEKHNLLDFPISATPVLELAAILLGVYGTQRTLEKLRGTGKG